MACNQDDQEANAERRQLRLEVEPAHTRRADIEHKTPRDVLPLGVEKLLG
jgi:hypothetical protein